MSNKDELPPELAALERALAAPGPLPGAGMRQRVLAAVGRELAQHPHASTLEGGTHTGSAPTVPQAMPTWQYLAALAACVLLALNASVVFNTSGRTIETPAAAIVLTADDLKLAAELGLSERELRLSFLAAPVGRPVPTAAYRPCALPKDLTLE
jgi:hypothetical protein